MAASPPGQRQTLSQHLSPSRSGIVRNVPSETQEPALEMRSETADHDPTSPPHPSKIPSPFRETDSPPPSSGSPPPTNRDSMTTTVCPALPRQENPFARRTYRRAAKYGTARRSHVSHPGKESHPLPSSRFPTEDAPYPSPRRSTIAPFSGAATEDSACSERLSAIFADIPDVPSRRNDPPLSVSGKEPRLPPEKKAPPGHRILQDGPIVPAGFPTGENRKTDRRISSRRRIRTKPPDRNTRTRLAP